MHSSVNDLLGFDEGCIPNREIVVIGQENENQNGHFLLHQIMSAAVKENKAVCLVSFYQTFHHYRTVAQKIGVNLQAAVDGNRLLFLDGLEEIADTFHPTGEEEEIDKFTGLPLQLSDVLEGVKEKILQRVSELRQRVSDGEVVLVVDDVSVLVSLGCGVGDVCLLVSDLMEALLFSELEGEIIEDVMGDEEDVMGDEEDVMGDEEDCPPNGSMVVMCSHADVDRNSGSLWDHLCLSSTMHVTVSPLHTGHCAHVHGQVLVEWRHGLDGPSDRAFSSSCRQFKLGDNSVEFFAAGMSRAVL